VAAELEEVVGRADLLDPEHRAPHLRERALQLGPRLDALAQVWRAVLGVEQVGATDDFFELGGHSLLAVQVVIRIEDELGAEVSLRDLYDHPTIAGLSAMLAR